LIWLPARRFLSVLLRRWPFLDLFAYAALVRLSAYGVGLSLISYWFISVAPVRGGHLLFFACRKEKQPYWKSSVEPVLKVEAVSRREHFTGVSCPRDLHD
jgi:hypothetical protein